MILSRPREPWVCERCTYAGEFTVSAFDQSFGFWFRRRRGTDFSSGRDATPDGRGDRGKVQEVLSKVTVDSSIAPPVTEAPEKVHFLAYNAEQGLSYEDLSHMLSNGEDFIADKIKNPSDKTHWQIYRAGNSDIMVFSELDVGVCRSGYRDDGHDLAQVLKMNYAYAPEFLELEPKDLGAQGGAVSCSNVDYSKTQNLTANGIFSKYPIQNARKLDLENCYDWFDHEMNPPWYKKLFHWPRQLRRGQRSAVLADVIVGGDIGTITVVSTHLEVNSGPDCRQRQLEQILDVVKDVKNPVIIAGDMNTIHIRGPEGKLFKEWKAAGFDLSGNDGKGTDLDNRLKWLHIRLDHVGVRGLQPEDGETLTELGKHGLEISDHAPIVVDLDP